MSDLKPIGSEKLQGLEKINRIIEISRYKENTPSKLNENEKSVFEVGLHDGNQYQIVKERLGYIIKKVVSESVTDYIEPMKNRKYYSSYSQALKRLNLLTKEINRLNEVEEGQSLFNEDKKFVLKTPKSDSEEVPDTPPAPMEPPAVPTPDLPPSPISGDEVTPDIMPDEEIPSGEMSGMDEPMPDEEDSEKTDEQEGVTFRMIQKLTGKLSQKIREFENENGLTSENIKYVVNMILSSVDLSALSEEDKEDIMMKFEGEESGEEEIPSTEDELPSEEPMMGSEETPAPEEEMAEGYGSILDNIFKESKVDKVISRYFNISEKEKKYLTESSNEKKLRTKKIVDTTMKHVIKLTETIEQEMASKKFLQENPHYTFVGKTNKKNLIFENKTNQVKISPEGIIK